MGVIEEMVGKQGVDVFTFPGIAVLNVIYVCTQNRAVLINDRSSLSLEKPVREAELFSALDLAFLMLRAGEQRSYSVKTRDGYVCLSGRNIVTVENQNRAAVYVLSGGGAVRSVSIRGTFEEAVAPLPDDPDFTRPHKSYYVNMRHIHVLRPGLLLLDDGREISVSRSFSAQVNQDYLRYLSQEEGKTL